MGRQPPVERNVRTEELLRHLGEAAEQEAADRERLVTALDRILAAPLRDLPGFVRAVTAAALGIDAVSVVVRDRDRWRVEAALGTQDTTDAPLLDPRTGAVIAHLAGGREPSSTTGGAIGATLLPETTRAALAVPLLDGAGEPFGLALFGSRSEHQLTREDNLVARLAAERMSRALERELLASRVARAEEAAGRTSAFRDNILAIVGHDLRNPLGAVVMSAVLLQKKGGLAGWQARTIERVRASAARMSRIIDDLLSYTRTRLGNGIPIERGRADLGDIAQRMVEELRVAHPGARLELAAEGVLSGEWDVVRLEQVISNLVSNAIDHGDEDHPVSIALRGLAEEVEVAVQNRGEMPQEVLAHAFEAFHRGPEQTGRKASGLGLGLFIAREIVRGHGGEIWARSEGGATRLLVRIPRGASVRHHAPGA